MNKILFLITLICCIPFICQAGAIVPTTPIAPTPAAPTKTLQECQLDVKNEAQALASEINNLKQAVDKIGTQHRRHINR
jgi:Na+-transporting methylmalonyl-CoA/oxaloacetate decarboxylase gamma subunit